MAKHPFLSDPWFDEVRRLHDLAGGAAPEGADIRMNLVVQKPPFGGGDLALHLAAAGGQADWGKGHLDDADVTLTLGYDTARAIFVDGNPQAAIEAFMAGRIIVQGDITKLMAMQAAGPGSAASTLTRALQDITEYRGRTRPCPEGVGHPGPVAAGEHHPALADAPTPPGHGTPGS